MRVSNNYFSSVLVVLNYLKDCVLDLHRDLRPQKEEDAPLRMLSTEPSPPTIFWRVSSLAARVSYSLIFILLLLLSLTPQTKLIFLVQSAFRSYVNDKGTARILKIRVKFIMNRNRKNTQFQHFSIQIFSMSYWIYFSREKVEILLFDSNFSESSLIKPELDCFLNPGYINTKAIHIYWISTLKYLITIQLGIHIHQKLTHSHSKK